MDEKSKYFNEDGIYVESNLFSNPEVSDLKKNLQQASEIEEAYFRERLPTVKRTDANMVHNTFLYSNKILNVLEKGRIDKILNDIFCKNSIIYAFQSSSAPPQSSNYGGRIHVDAPRFVPNYTTNVGLIIALDDFTPRNGATQFIRGSHKMENCPTEEEFEQKKESWICKAGDALFFNARIWHRTGMNFSNRVRDALTINFCRPYMKTRFDFPRLIEKHKITVDLCSQTARYLGYWTRTPATLEEFYVAPEERLYKSGLE